MINEAACKRAYDAIQGVKEWDSFRLGWEAAIKHLYGEAVDEARAITERVPPLHSNCAPVKLIAVVGKDYERFKEYVRKLHSEAVIFKRTLRRAYGTGVEYIFADTVQGIQGYEFAEVHTLAQFDPEVFYHAAMLQMRHAG